MAVLKNAFAKRLSGGKPSPPQAMLAALVAGAGAAALTYKIVRS